MNKRILYGVFGSIGGLLLTALLMFMYIPLYANKPEVLYSHDFILFCTSSFVVLSIAGFLSGIRYFQKKPTQKTWLIAYIFLYVFPILWDILRNEHSKGFLIITLFYIFAFIYAELSDYVWKTWMRYVNLRFFGAPTTE